MLLILDGMTEAKEAEKPTWDLKTSLALALSCLQPVSPVPLFFLEHLWRWLCRLSRASSSSPGLLNLEKLLRQFLISKDTLSVRMLDDTRDPTPLLKEIRDDKTATIIIHANASMSHTILLKVGAWLGWVLESIVYPSSPVFSDLSYDSPLVLGWI